ncbi:glycosyltransferase family 4 protein [Qipengyuania sp.]|uniref:glycosyltransferase family 4 protein n=1 Tax=Qipengyuania sp. TaxID=2004515 RepID=UPI003BACD255
MNGEGIGGAELQFVELANQLDHNHDVTLVCLQGSNSVQAGKLSPNIQIKEFPYPSGSRSLGQLFRAIQFCRRLEYDAIVTTAFIGDFVGSLSKHDARQKLISLQTISAKKRHHFADRILLKRYDSLVAGCRDIEKFLISNGQSPGKIRVINNWVDFSARKVTKSVSEVRANYGFGEAGAVVGCIGRMHHQKGQEYLIRAFLTLSEHLSDAMLVLVGDGPLKSEMMKEAGASKRVVFTGTVTGDDYTNLLNSFDVYVQPSRFEGLPRTLLDAMYMGLPIVASAANGMSDIIKHGENGWLVPPEDERAIVTALEYLLRNRECAQKAGKIAAHDARKNYAMSEQTAKIEQLIFQ